MLSTRRKWLRWSRVIAPCENYSQSQGLNFGAVGPLGHALRAASMAIL